MKLFKTETDIRKQKNGRALAKLLVSANKVKTVLSANKETKAQVENLVDEEDFKAMVSREELENCIQGKFLTRDVLTCTMLLIP